MSETCGNTIDLGLLDYQSALNQQLERVGQRARNEVEDVLFLVEHPPVYTLGRRLGAEKNLLWNEKERTARGIELFEISRGGDVTYHCPGQLVAYPVVSLANHKDLHSWLRFLEEVILNTLKQFGLSACRSAGKTGIWVENRKIAAIGVAVKQWVTYHGLALNVDNDLSGFQGIIACGLQDAEVTSMQNELSGSISLNEVKSALSIEFWRLFPDIGNL